MHLFSAVGYLPVVSEKLCSTFKNNCVKVINIYPYCQRLGPVWCDLSIVLPVIFIHIIFRSRKQRHRVQIHNRNIQNAICTKTYKTAHAQYKKLQNSFLNALYMSVADIKNSQDMHESYRCRMLKLGVWTPAERVHHEIRFVAGVLQRLPPPTRRN